MRSEQTCRYGGGAGDAWAPFGNTHVVYTAVALIWNLGEFTETFVEASEVRFKISMVP